MVSFSAILVAGLEITLSLQYGPRFDAMMSMY